MSPRVGIVVVSHSAALARAALDLALEMVAGDPPSIELAAGTPTGGTGTDAARVAEAIQAADEGVGVVVLMDLGSAILSAELALEFCPPDTRAVLVGAPFVEGLVAAVVRASAGATLEDVANEARAALSPKASHLGDDPALAMQSDVKITEPPDATATATVVNVDGLHARPAAALAAVAGAFAARSLVSFSSSRADARSPLALAALDARLGAVVTLEAWGADAEEAVAALGSAIASGFGEEVVDVGRETQPRAARTGAARLGVSRGRAVGPVHVLRRATHEPPAASHTAPERVEEEIAAVAAAGQHVAAAYRDRASRVSGQAAHVLEATAMMATDPTIVEGAARRIREGMGSARAVWDVIRGLVVRYEAAGGLLAGRVPDLVDVRDRLIATLTGQPEVGLPPSGDPFVLVASDLAPADTALLDPTRCRAIVTERGSATSHTAILARELGIPAVVGFEGALELTDGTTVLVDGSTGEVILDPSDEVMASVTAVETPEPFEGPCVLSDGRRILLSANVGASHDAAGAAAWGAEGVGLFRTEFCFLDRVGEPSIEEQVEHYTTVLNSVANQRVVIRTLDAGSDKPLPFLTADHEPNPSLGVRGYRTARIHPGALSRQLEAIALAARRTGTSPWVMAPMISTVEEATDFVDLVRSAGLDQAGVMIETPSAAAMAREICDVVDFVSVGTNDLAQYVMAADRMSPDLADLTDPWQPAVLRTLAAIAAACVETETPVGVCGESASRPDYAAILVGLGVTSLSMSPRLIPDVARVLRRVSTEACAAAAAAAVAAPTAASAREAATITLRSITPT
jgi:phosphotransferase system enzyme I (PtsI)